MSIIYEEKPENGEKSREDEEYPKKRKSSKKKTQVNKKEIEYQRKFLNDYDASILSYESANNNQKPKKE